MNWHCVQVTIVAAAVLSGPGSRDVFAQTNTQPTNTQDLRRLSLEALLEIDVETVSRAPEPLMRVPAALFVITREDIRRSGASSIPEALRLAPGVQVARINAGTWAIGMRGFADRLARSMLVLIDGRAVYSPLFAGTYWETQDTLLEDIDRIEVIRGPGGTLWGANAVNGIINIITRNAKDTQGPLAVVSTGSELRGMAGFRYGGLAGPAWSYRVYGKALDRGPQFHSDGVNFDGFTIGQGGFRADWAPAAGESLTIQGDAYGARLGQRETLTIYERPFTLVTARDAPLSGANALVRWGRPAGRSRFQLQSFYTRTSRDERPVKETRDTFDIDFQFTDPLWRGNQVVWGVGYRVTSGEIVAIPPTVFSPPTRTDHLFSAFVQDEISLSPDRLRLTLGSKFEHNDYSGFEAQPGVRLLWTPNDTNTVWSAVTSAVRTPSRVETDYSTSSLVNPAVPLFVRLHPNPEFKSERLVAYELGYRIRPIPAAFLAVSGFYNRLDNVISTEVLAPVPEPAVNPTRVVIPLTFGNGLEGESYGLEFAFDARATERWRWTANYSYLRIEMLKKPGSLDGSQETRNEGLSPRHQLEVRSSVDLNHGVSIDAAARVISRLAVGPIPRYGTVDLRIGWQLAPQLELSFVGQDLADAHHVEWPGSPATGIQRSGYVTLVWRR